MFEGRRALYVQLALFAIAIGLLLVLSCFFPLVDLVDAAQRRVMHWGAWSGVCYPLLFAFCNVLLLPGGLLSVGGGFFFGLWWGFFIVLVGNVGGAAIAFIVSRRLGRSWIQRKLLRNSAIQALEPAVEREGWKIILLSQLHPLF